MPDTTIHKVDAQEYILDHDLKKVFKKQVYTDPAGVTHESWLPTNGCYDRFKGLVSGLPLEETLEIPEASIETETPAEIESVPVFEQEQDREDFNLTHQSITDLLDTSRNQDHI